MRTTVLFLLLILCLSFVSFAQQKRIAFEGAVQAGLLEGEVGSAVQFGAMAGIKKNSWTASAASGLDYYGIRSIPLYFNLQKNIFSKSNTPFVFGGVGHHFLWPDNSNYNSFYSWRSDSKHSGGLYYNLGFGYQLPALKKASLFFTAGYSYKSFTQQTEYVYPCITGDCPEYKEKVFHQLRRLSVTTGLRF